MNQLTELSFVGPLHNRVMQNVAQLSNFPTFTNLEVYNIAKADVSSYYENHNLGDPKIQSFNDLSAGIESVLAQGESFVSFFNDLFSQQKINQEQLDFLLEINDLFQNADNPNNLAENLFSLEEQVETSSMTFDEKSLVYGSSVIGRNSAYYWFSAYNNQNDPWNDPDVLAVKWWVRGLRDLVGFVAGFVATLWLPGASVPCGLLVGTACSAAND